MEHDNLVQIRHQEEKWMQYSEQFLEENIQPDNVELESCKLSFANSCYHSFPNLMIVLHKL